jgi:peptidoglycan/LPS O-acetylase OafA/YrhL
MVDSRPAPSQLHYADFFRALAIFIVFLGHIATFACEPALFHGIRLTEALSLFDGVAMLFCLSGFLLSAPFLRAYLDPRGPFPLVPAYLYARFLRIVPLYLASVVAIALYLRVAGPQPGAGDIVTHLLLLHDLQTPTIQSLSSPLWTMPLDVTFYFCLPLVFIAMSRMLANASQTARVRALFALLGIVAIASALFRFYSISHVRWPDGNIELLVRDQFPGMMSLFAIGVGARLIVMLRAGRPLAASAPAAVALGIIGLAVVFRGGQLLSHLEWVHLLSGGHSKSAALVGSLEYLIAGAGCALLLVLADTIRSGWFARFAASRIVVFAAAISYALYLLHFTVLTSISDRLGWNGYRGEFVIFAIGLAILVPVCALAHYGIEKPFLDRKARLKRVAA